jgi:hypothetical protein
MKEIRVLGVLLEERSKVSVSVQDVLCNHGCSIKTRLGLHEVGDNLCANYGLILLELFGDPKEMDELENALIALEGVTVKKMVF